MKHWVGNTVDTWVIALGPVSVSSVLLVFNALPASRFQIGDPLT